MRINNIFIRQLNLLVTFLLLSLFTSYTLSAANNNDVVEIEVAQFVASEYLATSSKGEWIFFSQHTYYAIDGKPAAYAFVFRKPECQIRNVEKLEVIMKDAYEKRTEMRHQLRDIERSEALSESNSDQRKQLLEKKMRYENERLYQFSNFTTVLTGATETSSLILRFYPGLPPIVAERFDLQRELDNNYPRDQLVLGRILYYGVVDIRYEVTPQSVENPPAPESVQGIWYPVPDEAYVMTWKEKTLTSISTRRQQVQKTRANRQMDLAKMKDSERERYDKGIENRRKRNIDEWKRYRIKKANLRMSGE